MNSCVLMAEIINEPQLRYTADNLGVTEMLVQFPNSQKPEDPPATLKVVGWGNLATEIQQNYHQGDRVILVGRLSMNTVDRQEGFKEKRAELTVQQIQSVGSSFNTTSFSSTPTPSFTETSSPRQAPPSRQPETNFSTYESQRPAPTPAPSPVGVTPPTNYEPTPQPANYERTTYPAVKPEEPDPDDIPF
ncbi:single-stranded DNA-binding protein [Nostoc linckia z18]|jgi:single-stranded DNA-binding protein|uniref:Single-stranded DNA-binding protein n=2 Tax=Nostoc linckia TaxID=92942 RepID=A0A9Q5Z883_NOSLI|nr:MULTISPECIES: single-stranded DNA-binding protein [Nostoc]MBL1197941.1 single-stranded DNA-binding protein [Nostoc sp. GBBB01]MDZ8011180.1 single-stranded DNA-binding protein [Nostoc sp. ZfuVER08]PHK39212.1 single-stranded DNA-binding protein [Nostoc linckia z15]PHK43742.1 single-stranded DNA-binding protein [Nostoc linckia z16]MBC1239052.1 single-stranded DNA-binding protein [Nostoc sp. 2RC]